MTNRHRTMELHIPSNFPLDRMRELTSEMTRISKEFGIALVTAVQVKKPEIEVNLEIVNGYTGNRRSVFLENSTLKSLETASVRSLH